MAVRALGGSIGTTVYSAILQNKATVDLPTQVAKYAILAGLPAASAPAFVEEFLTDSGKISSFPHVTAKIIEGAALGEAWGYQMALKYVWVASVAFGSVACLMCLFIPNTQSHLTNRVAVVSVRCFQRSRS
jgi:putative copper export protein